MTTDYDPIAEQYQQSKQQPWRTHIESFTLLNLLGDLTGLSVLDVACGEGFYTRRLRSLGAAQILGIDLSERMIELAQRQETAHPLGIEYRVGDGRELALAEPQDLVLAAYLLNYARDRDELRAMCDGIARCLKPGGRFVTVNSNPALDFSRSPSYRLYGFQTSASGPLQAGTPVQWEFFLEEGPFSIENYYLDVAAHEEALRSAGFREVRWHAPAVSSEGTAAFGSDYWETFQKYPPVTFIECVK